MREAGQLLRSRVREMDRSNKYPQFVGEAYLWYSPSFVFEFVPEFQNGDFRKTWGEHLPTDRERGKSVSYGVGRGVN